MSIINPKELDKEKDVIQIIYGAENAISAGLYCLSSTEETIDLYADGIGVYSMFEYPESLNSYKEALSRGVKIRVITEITKDNLPSIKEGLQYISDIRHMDTITHYFGVSEKHYLSSKLQDGNPSLTETIFSNIGWFVREHQYLFETLWKKAISLRQRIREIEEGQKREFVDTIREPAEVLNLLPNIVSSAYEEIMLLFPNLNALRGFESSGLVESIKNHTQKNSSIRVKLLLKDQQQCFSSSQIKGSGGTATNTKTLIGQNNVEVKLASPDKMDTNTALIIVDGEKMVTIELDEKGNDSSSSSSSSTTTAQPNLSKTIRFATHTNSESATMSHISIFERLWIESEMRQH